MIAVPAEDSDYEEGRHRITAKGLKQPRELLTHLWLLVKAVMEVLEAVMGVLEVLVEVLEALVLVSETVVVLESVVKVLKVAVEVLEAVVEDVLKVVAEVLEVVVMVVVVMVMMETADTSYPGYDDSPGNDHESSEENLDYPEEEHQASTQRLQGTGKRPRTVQPTTARALRNARRRPTGAVAEIIASSDVSVDVVQTKYIPESAHGIPESLHRIPESVDFGIYPGSISESIPGISESSAGISQSTPNTLTVHGLFLTHSFSRSRIQLFYTEHRPFLDAFDLRSRSADVRSMQAPRIEMECSMLIRDYTLLHEPFPPAARLSVLLVSTWTAASRRVECTVDLDEDVIKQLRSLHSRLFLHLMQEVKGSGRLANSTIYGLGNLTGPEARAIQVEYLLKNDCS
ncbi:hypothetical protein DFP73DRAFT_600761 [Morchella snyderi]|nr:hypothetical protein DFP73DRAFT_600761 [Morchella snyderi]